MSFKKWMRLALREIGIDARRIPRRAVQTPQHVYAAGGNVPWSPGYLETRNRKIAEILADAEILDLFRRGAELPAGYGVAFDERLIEYPWLFANLHDDTPRVLDAGSVMNHRFLIEHPLVKRMKLYILTLFPESDCFWEQGVSYLYDDLRNTPLQSEYCDIVICLSTLEHVGFDNSMYTGNDTYRQRRPDDFLVVIKELRRVLKPGGSLFLSVPYGAYRDLGWSQQFDRELLTRATEVFDRPCEVTETFYRYTREGWQKSTDQDCADAEYVEWIARAWQHNQMPYPIPIEPDRAAAARAVACIKLVKGII